VARRARPADTSRSKRHASTASGGTDKGPAQPGDQGLERVGCAGRRLVIPQRVDQRAGRDHPARIQREPDQQRSQARATDLDGHAGAGAHLERTQQRDLHETILPRDDVLS
jgi:hypothetical protein